MDSDPDSDYSEPEFLRGEWDIDLDLNFDGRDTSSDGPPVKPERKINNPVPSTKTKIVHDPRDVYNTNYR